jgi:hypothetical protein
MNLQAPALHHEVFAAFFNEALQILAGSLTKAKGDLPSLAGRSNVIPCSIIFLPGTASALPDA